MALEQPAKDKMMRRNVTKAADEPEALSPEEQERALRAALIKVAIARRYKSAATDNPNRYRTLTPDEIAAKDEAWEEA